MALFTKAETTTAYLKMGIMGFQGSGKTFTAASIAIGLHKLCGGGKPIGFIDTEKGSDWVAPRIRAAGIGLVTAKTRAFADLVEALPEAEANHSVLIIDSVTHFWTELCDTYCSNKARQLKRPEYRLQFQDWAFLKKEWRRFTDLFVNSRLHIVLCGRAGYEYDFIEDEQDNRKKNLEKTGIKFKAEGEMGYEPDLLVLMERHMNMGTKTDEHIAHVVKDRSMLLDGKEFADPTFETFLPHIQCLNLGGQQMGVDTTRTSSRLIPTEPRDDRGIQRKIVLEEIENLLVEHYPGQTANEKKTKIALLRQHFAAPWAEMENLMTLERLRAGFDALHVELKGEPSRYSTAAAAADKAPVDELPDHSAPPKIDATETENGTPAFLARAKPNGEASYVDLMSVG